MAKKVVLSFDDFKRMTGNGSSVPLINFLTKQKIGKVEFTTEPWDNADDFTSPELKDKFGGKQIAKWVIDLEKGTFTKFNNGKPSHTEKLETGELIGEIVDLIKLESKNKYSNVTVYRRTSIPNYQSETNLKENMNLKGYINKIIKEETSKVKLTEAFDENQLKEIVDEGVTLFWEGFNKIEVAMNYMRQQGQSGAIGAFQKQYKVAELEDIFNKLSRFSDKG